MYFLLGREKYGEVTIGRECRVITIQHVLSKLVLLK